MAESDLNISELLARIEQLENVIPLETEEIENEIKLEESTEFETEALEDNSQLSATQIKVHLRYNYRRWKDFTLGGWKRYQNFSGNVKVKDSNGNNLKCTWLKLEFRYALRPPTTVTESHQISFTTPRISGHSSGRLKVKFRYKGFQYSTSFKLG